MMPARLLQKGPLHLFPFSFLAFMVLKRLPALMLFLRVLGTASTSLVPGTSCLYSFLGFPCIQHAIGRGLGLQNRSNHHKPSKLRKKAFLSLPFPSFSHFLNITTLVVNRSDQVEMSICLLQHKLLKFAGRYLEKTNFFWSQKKTYYYY